MFTPRQASASYEEVLRIKLLELGQRVDINSDGLARVIYGFKCDDGSWISLVFQLGIYTRKIGKRGVAQDRGCQTAVDSTESAGRQLSMRWLD